MQNRVKAHLVKRWRETYNALAKDERATVDKIVAANIFKSDE